MTFPVRPDSLMREIDHAREMLKRRSEQVAEIVDGMAGRTSLKSTTRLKENHYYEFASYALPRIVSQDPRVRVVSPHAGRGAIVAAGSTAACNQWITQTRHRVLAQRLCTDYLVGWGAACMRLEGRADDDDDLYVSPVVDQLHRESAWWDVAAIAWERKRFSGYSYAIDKDDLIERGRKEKGWNRALLKDLPTDIGLDEVARDGRTPRRKEVVIREVWVADTNKIYTVAVGGTSRKPLAVQLREPMDFFGPPWGPIYLYDAYYVPGQPLGMGPMEAVAEHVEELNAHVEQLSRDVASRKRIGIGRKQDAGDADTIRGTMHGQVALLASFDPAWLKEYEFGGATPEQRNAILELRERLQRISGLGDVQRGAVTGVGSPTEVAIANEAGGLRISYLAQRFSDCDEQLLRGWLWYFLNSQHMRHQVHARDLGAPEDVDATVTITGGPEKGMDHNDFSLSIERYTMERTSEAAMQRQAMSLVQQTLAVLQAAPMISQFGDVGVLLDVLGEANNRPGWGQIVNGDIAAKQGAMQQAAAQAGPGDQPQAEPQTAPQRALAGVQAA